MKDEHFQIAERDIEQFRTEGYMVFDRVVPPDDLAFLRAMCEAMIAETDRRIDAGETDRVAEITHKGKRYFMDGAFPFFPELGRVVFSDYMARITRAALGDTVYHFKNQFVVKCAEVGMNFAWHQDSGYITEPHTPYLTTWCALDDVTEENGTIYILPWSRSNAGGRFIDHVRQAGTNDLVGYDGDDVGEPVLIPAGGMAIFSSLTLHRSGANTTNRPRSVYLMTYSPEPMPLKEGTTRMVEPFLKDGKRVREK